MSPKYMRCICDVWDLSNGIIAQMFIIPNLKPKQNLLFEIINCIISIDFFETKMEYNFYLKALYNSLAGK